MGDEFVVLPARGPRPPPRDRHRVRRRRGCAQRRCPRRARRTRRAGAARHPRRAVEPLRSRRCRCTACGSAASCAELRQDQLKMTEARCRRGDLPRGSRLADACAGAGAGETNRGMAGRDPDGRALPAGPHECRRLRADVLRRRSQRRGLPRRRGARASARRDPRVPAGHVGASADERPALRRRDRADRQSADPRASWSVRACSWSDSTTAGVGSATTHSSATCFASSCTRRTAPVSAIASSERRRGTSNRTTSRSRPTTWSSRNSGMSSSTSWAAHGRNLLERGTIGAVSGWLEAVPDESRRQPQRPVPDAGDCAGHGRPHPGRRRDPGPRRSHP